MEMATEGRRKATLPLVEHVSIPDTFASGIGAVEIFGTFVRYILYAEHRTPRGETERVVVAKLIMPLESLPANARMTMDAMATMGLTFSESADGETAH